MLKYLVIQLDDSSPSFCHYKVGNKAPRLIPLDTLKQTLVWSMKENLTVQFLYPDYEVPQEYKEVIDMVYHADIVSSESKDAELVENGDVVVFDSFEKIKGFEFKVNQAYIVRCSIENLLDNEVVLTSMLSNVNRINIVFTDIENFDKNIENRYCEFLDRIVDFIVSEYKTGHLVQLNLLTDRILLDGMNNCNAGYESITLCPDGKYYICPAFYEDEHKFSVGDVERGVEIKNPQLYRLDHAPICRICDAWQCKRCVWLNRKLTLEVNTPSREQCIMAHLERNASRRLLSEIRKINDFLPESSIKKIDYLDPFEKIVKDY